MFLAKSYCDIGNSQSSSSTVAPDGEISTTFEYDGIQRLVRVTDTEVSNPSLSANSKVNSAASQRLVAVFYTDTKTHRTNCKKVGLNA